MEYLIGVIALLIMQFLKKYVKGTLYINLSLVIISLIGAYIYKVLNDTGNWETAVNIFLTAGSIYGIFRGLNKEKNQEIIGMG